MSWGEAKPLQDYMVHQLLLLARKHNLPVAFHTGMQAGPGNYVDNSDPSLLSGIFMKYPDIRFVLYHGSYPFGGKLSVLAKTFRNVWVDMNWTWSISPSYAAVYLKEFLETVPVSKIMAFGGDQRCIENTYGELRIAKKIISDVLIESVTDGSMTENEAFAIAKMILRDNAVEFYNLV
jgi:predicted TIM-barrel fold metal-dependent hydrolase